MATAYDFILSGDQAVARERVIGALAELGFTAEPSSTGGVVAKKGSMTRTVLLGALAGKGFHLSFPVDFYSDPSGNLIARISRDLGVGALKGGALGANKTNNAFIATTESLGKSLSAAGLLLSTAAH